MEWRMVWTTFFLLMALTTIVSYLVQSSNGVELIVAVSMNLIATTMKMGARRMLGAMMMAASLVADFHLFPALAAYYIFHNTGLADALAWGALIANLISVILLIIEAVLRQLELEELS